MARRDQLIQALEFLEILESTVCTSVGGLTFMHRIRFSTLTQNSLFDIDDSICCPARNSPECRSQA
jgi:hypothetical protein